MPACRSCVAAMHTGSCLLPHAWPLQFCEHLLGALLPAALQSGRQSPAAAQHALHCVQQTDYTLPCAVQFSNIFKGVTQEKLDDLVERFQREEFHAGGGPCSPNYRG